MAITSEKLSKELLRLASALNRADGRKNSWRRPRASSEVSPRSALRKRSPAAAIRAREGKWRRRPDARRPPAQRLRPARPPRPARPLRPLREGEGRGRRAAPRPTRRPSARFRRVRLRPGSPLQAALARRPLRRRSRSPCFPSSPLCPGARRRERGNARRAVRLRQRAGGAPSREMGMAAAPGRPALPSPPPPAAISCSGARGHRVMDARKPGQQRPGRKGCAACRSFRCPLGEDGAQRLQLRDRAGREVGASTSYGWACELASVPRTASCVHHRECALFRSMLNLGSFVAIGFPHSCLRPWACTNPWVSTRSSVLDLSMHTWRFHWLLLQAWVYTDSCLH